MNLSAKLIIHKLRQHFQLHTSDRISSEPCLKYPVLYQNDLPLKANLIYVIDDPDFLVPLYDLRQVLLLFVGKTDSISLTGNPNICIIDSEVSTAWVFQVLQEIYEVYNDWTQNIFQLTRHAPSVQKLLEISMAAIPNPLSVASMDFRLVGATDDDFDNLKDSVFGSTEETQVVVNSLKNDPNYEKTAMHTGYYYYPGTVDALPALCVNIQLKGQTAYRLIVSPGEMPLDDTIGFLAEFLADNAAQVIQHSLPMKKDDHLSRQHVFHRLLTNPKADYVDVSRDLSLRGWLVSHYYQCVLIQTGTADWKNLTLRSICSYIENTIPESCAVEVEENIVVYINLTLCSMNLDEIMQKLAHFIRDNILSASYSRKMMGHFNFYRQYQQAKLTMQLGALRNPTSWVHHFDDIALPYCLEQITRRLPAYMICHERLLQMKYQDENSDSQLYETLRCYLENHQSATKTAQILYIHRSTLLYRLDRIRKFLKSDLSDPDELLYLLLSYRLMDEEEKQ